jgi:transcriptional regulator with XRE-family HTH domain
MQSNSFANLISSVRECDEYWQDEIKLEFAVGIGELMDSKDISKADLARKIGKSAAYVTKALRGDTNFTIESMVQLARAVGGRVHLKVADDLFDGAKFVPWLSNRAKATAPACWDRPIAKFHPFRPKGETENDSRRVAA